MVHVFEHRGLANQGKCPSMNTVHTDLILEIPRNGNGIEDYIPSQYSNAYTVWEIGKNFDTSPHLCTTPLSLKAWEIDGVSTTSKPKEQLIKVAIVES